MIGRGRTSETKQATPKAPVKKDSRIKRSLAFPPKAPAIMLTKMLPKESRAIGSSVRVRLERHRRLDPADDRRDAIAGDRFIRRELAEYLDPPGREPDFLRRLAQRRRRMARIVRLDAPAGKADLPRVVGECGASLRQQHVQALRPIDERNEHRGRCGLAFASRQPESVAQALRAFRNRTRQALGEPGALKRRGEVEQRKTHRE